MESFSMEQLSKVLQAPVSSSALFEQLSQYEAEACVLLTNPKVADPELVSTFYSAFLISHLFVDEMNEGRMLTLRLPPGLAGADPTLQNCLTLFRAVWQKDHAQVYLILRELPWPDILQSLIRRYELHFQNTAFQDLSKAYEAIKPATAATYLGLAMDPDVGMDLDAGSANKTVAHTLTTRGWNWDADAGLLHPKAATCSTSDRMSSEKGLGEVL